MLTWASDSCNNDLCDQGFALSQRVNTQSWCPMYISPPLLEGIAIPRCESNSKGGNFEFWKLFWSGFSNDFFQWINKFFLRVWLNFVICLSCCFPLLLHGNHHRRPYRLHCKIHLMLSSNTHISVQILHLRHFPQNHWTRNATRFISNIELEVSSNELLVHSLESSVIHAELQWATNLRVKHVHSVILMKWNSQSHQLQLYSFTPSRKTTLFKSIYCLASPAPISFPTWKPSTSNIAIAYLPRLFFSFRHNGPCQLLANFCGKSTN